MSLTWAGDLNLLKITSASPPGTAFAPFHPPHWHLSLGFVILLPSAPHLSPSSRAEHGPSHPLPSSDSAPLSDDWSVPEGRAVTRAMRWPQELRSATGNRQISKALRSVGAEVGGTKNIY